MKDIIRNFFIKHIKTAEIRDDSDIFQLGYVNSLFALQVVNFLEKQFSFKIENEDLSIDNFRSINNIYALVKRKQNNLTVGIDN